MTKCMRVLFCVVLVLMGFYSSAQDLLKRNDLSQVKVDQISDADLMKLQQQLQQSGYTVDQAEQLAQAKGMPAAEAAKLKERLARLGMGSGNGTGRSYGRNDSTRASGRRNRFDTLSLDSLHPLIDPKIFGSELFNNRTLSYDPGISVATPFNYVLGANDQLELTVYGVQETNISLEVSKEGVVSIPNVGQVKVIGLTIEEATAKIKQVMERTAYGTLRSGASKLALNIGGIRSLHVTVIGSNRPGNYTLSSLATAFNALYVAGGPNKFGSFRQIQLIRNNKLERTIDLYHFLVNGDQSDNIRLKDNDVIRIPAYKTRVELKGEVKRPGIFEVLPGESFANVLEFASGFTDSAYKAAVTVMQFTDRERQVKDITAAEFGNYTPQPGDTYEIGKLLKRFTNRLHITGAVFRPGYYELKEGMHVADLIRRADGLKEDAYTARAQVVRLKEDLSKEIISFNVTQALKGSASDNIPLKREDEIIITSIFDLRDEYKVTIQGEVRRPGEYMFADSMSVKDLVVLAGGLTEAAFPQRIEVARLLRQDSLTAADIRASDVYEIQSGADLGSATQNLRLHAYDLVTIHSKPGPKETESVVVDGQVQYPGPYALANRSERVSSVLKRAGGFTPEAYLEGAYVKRFLTKEEREAKRSKIMKLQQALRDTSTRALTYDEYDQLPLNVPEILAHPNSTEDIVLKPKDEVIVPKFDAEVKVSGGVLLPTQIPYRNNYSVKDYVSFAGGFAPEVMKRKLYVLYANGSAKATKHFLFFKSYPKVKPGAEIVVPRKPPRRSNQGELIGIASALASVALVIVTLINTIK